MRRAVLAGFGQQSSDMYQPMLETRAAILALDILRNSQAREQHCRRFAASVVLGSVYGIPPIDDTSDVLVQRVIQLLQYISRAAVPGGFLVDSFPIMMHIPAWMAQWKKEGKAWHEDGSAVFANLIKTVKEERVSSRSSFAFKH